MAPGVYAWFYPLKIVSLDLDVLLRELGVVFDYDANNRNIAEASARLSFTWDVFNLNVKKSLKDHGIPSGVYKEWSETIENSHKFEEFRKALMSASILMPPLYVGKASSLLARCSQHLSGSSEINSFKDRFESYAHKMNLSVKTVKDLVFVCIQSAYGNYTESANVVNPHCYENPQSLLEEILKMASKPPYGIK